MAEIDAPANSRFNLQDACTTIAKHHHAILEAAFEQRLKEVGGAAVMLDAVVAIAEPRGYRGTVEQSASLLQVGGRFEIGQTPGGRVAVWESRRSFP